jgi:mono/diheme cytochrome c family protein
MRIKTLGIVLISALSLFTAFYWLTDPARRENEYQTQIKELVAYGEEMFGPNTPANDHTANCAACHGADGTGGKVGDTGRLAPNLRSKSIYEKLKAQNGGSFTEIRKPGDPPDYVNLVIRFGGVVVSGDVNSPMPAWSAEVGGALTVNQIDALTALIETWALEAGSKPEHGRGGPEGLRRRRLRQLPPCRPLRCLRPQSPQHRQRAGHRPADTDHAPRRVEGGLYSRPPRLPGALDQGLGGELQRRDRDRHAGPSRGEDQRIGDAGPDHLPAEPETMRRR